jgi:hypothetical protein
MEVDELTVTATAVTLPNITVAPGAKLVPVIVTVPPPTSEDEPGVMEVIVGIVDVVRISKYSELAPTASHKLTEIHDTLFRSYTPGGRGAVSFVQVVPFQSSATPPKEP